MKIEHLILLNGRLRADIQAGTNRIRKLTRGDDWFDITEPDTSQLADFLKPLRLHPLILDLAVHPEKAPNAVHYGQDFLMEIPVIVNNEAGEIGYITIIWREGLLITIHPFPYFAETIKTLLGQETDHLKHALHILYLIVDQIMDKQVHLQIVARDRILQIAQRLASNPRDVSANDLAQLRWQVDRMVSLAEGQLFCVGGLYTTDIDILRKEDRRAYIRDLKSSADIAEQTAYRLESRLNDLFTHFQMIRSEDSEKRLRILTILSAINLPLMLITGIYGMNLSWLPFASRTEGFLILIGIMVVIFLVELYIFRRLGWFD